MLSETEKETVQSHLAECEACREDYEMLLAVKQSMADMPQFEVSDRFRTGLHEKLVAEAAKKTSSAPARRPLWSWKKEPELQFALSIQHWVKNRNSLT